MVRTSGLNSVLWVLLGCCFGLYRGSLQVNDISHAQ
jgi:hypothetical protein